MQTRSIRDVESEGEKGPNVCMVCGVTHESEEDIYTDSQWIGCEFKSVDSKGVESKCGYWVHEKCVGLYPVERTEKISKGKGKGKSRKRSVDEGETFNRIWYCPDHRL